MATRRGEERIKRLLVLLSERAPIPTPGLKFLPDQLRKRGKGPPHRSRTEPGLARNVPGGQDARAPLAQQQSLLSLHCFDHAIRLSPQGFQ